MSERSDGIGEGVAPQQPGRAAVILLAVVFGVLHAWSLFQGIANLVAVPGVYEAFGITQYTPWWLLVVGVLVPPAAFVTALLLGRGWVVSHRVAVLAASLGAVNAVVLSSGALAPILLALSAG
jgi:hypothetical protein